MSKKFEFQMTHLKSYHEMKRMKFYSCLHNFSGLLNLFSSVPMVLGLLFSTVVILRDAKSTVIYLQYHSGSRFLSTKN